MTEKDLKNALLQEAVQGKLVPQIASEGNARDLLNEIRNEKSKLIKEGKLKKEKPLPELKEEEIPFDIPENWCWCRVGDIFQHNTGKAMNSSAKEINKTGSIRKFITTSNLYWNEFDFTNVKEMFFSDDELHRCTVTNGDILINEGGAYFGRTAIWDYDYDICFQNHVHRLRPFVEIERLYFYYIFYLYRNTNRMQSKGTAMPGLSSEVLHSTIIPLPPLAEQKRIVDAIEKFMPLIEEYGKKETELKAFNEQIDTFTKKAILQEAVQGKLVPQIAAEGNAKDLLEEIKKEKAKVAGKASSTSFASKTRTKELSPITEDEIPFDIPESWCWCKVEDITIPIGNKNNQIQSKEVLKDGKIPVVSQGQNLIDGYSNETEKAINDIPVIMFGDHTRNVKYIDFPFIIGADGTKFFKPILCNKYYIYYLITFISLKLRNRGYARHYSLLKEEWLPLPPLVEQKRIVDAIEKLLPLCEKLGGK